MRKSACVQLFEKYLCEVSNGCGYREHDNPAVRFSGNVKSGKYNELSDESSDLVKYAGMRQEIADTVYCYPDSNVLRNRLNITDQKESLAIEADITGERLAELQISPVQGSFDDIIGNMEEQGTENLFIDNEFSYIFSIYKKVMHWQLKKSRVYGRLWKIYDFIQLRYTEARSGKL